MPAAGTLYGLPELAEAVATATRLEERHRAMIDRLEAAILKQAQDAADSARRAGFWPPQRYGPDRIGAGRPGRGEERGRGSGGRMMDPVRSQQIADAYSTLFPRRVRQAHYALVAWAEEASPDGWPTPGDVERFARLYGVRRATLGALVGLLSHQERGVRSVLWVDAVRNPDAAYPGLVARYDPAVTRAFGWFCATTDLGWLTLPKPVLH